MYTIKNATALMLRRIRSKRYQEGKVTDKQLATELGITPASFSRLSTEVTEPKIYTWSKICKMHTDLFGAESTQNITNQVF